MQVTEQERDGLPRSDDGVPAAVPARRRSDVHLRPLLAAAVVLLLWFAWLLVPDPARQQVVGAPTPLPTWDGGPVVDGPEARAVPAPPAEPAPADDAPEGAPAEGAPADETSAGEAPAEEPPADEAPAGETPSDGAPAEEPVPVPQRGSGSFDVAPGDGTRAGSDGTLVTYSVEVEGGIPLEPTDVAQVVDAVLADQRSWTGGGEWSLQRTDTDPQVRIRITTPDTTDALCAPLTTNGQVSCRNGADVVLNALRWTTGANAWGDDVEGYREYLVNHELGHFLGYGHVGCPAEGELAPVMLQQTLGLQGCAPNGWPYP